MQNDKRTLKDLSITGGEADHNILSMIDRCTTFAGRQVLVHQVMHSPPDYEALCRQQEVIRYWTAHLDQWSELITNGTVVMLEKFYESADSYAHAPGATNWMPGDFFQKLFNKNEYFFTQFSLTHLSDFLRGCQQFVALLQQEQPLPERLHSLLEDMAHSLGHRLTTDLVNVKKETPYRELARLSFHARREMKTNVQRLIEQYALLDAWYAMAKATVEHGWQFPQLLPQQDGCFIAESLYHPLLSQAVTYDLRFDRQQNFMILTGANMSGKTTMMRSMGVAALLGHLGMGVPARSMTISFLKGIITNMHVEDDILKGESFFLAEVKNMKHTAEAIATDVPHLVLMDELFKGTNVHDAYECTRAIVDGLLLHPAHIFVLSTHLHEVAHHFSGHQGISFYCFTTTLGTDGNYQFNYELRPGISDDRIGYKILVKEGIVAILQQNSNEKLK
jgi:DNA mismatch repair ATPase MutS